MHYSNTKRLLFIALGWLCFGLGSIGIFLPLMPTVVFWILAVWFWSKGSSTLVEKVLRHSRYGAVVQAFLEHGIVSRKGKIAAISSMAVSYMLIFLFVQPQLIISLIIAVSLFSVGFWLWLRPESIGTEALAK